MKEFPTGLLKVIRFIDPISEWCGKLFAWLAVPLVAGVTYEVVARYILGAATIWSWDVNKQILAAMGALGGGYALLYGSHVSVDIFSRALSPRRIANLNLLTDILTVFSLAVLTWYLISIAWDSVAMLEKDVSTFQPPLYPLRVAIAAGSVLLLLQAFCNLLKNLTASLGWVREPESRKSGGSR